MFSRSRRPEPRRPAPRRGCAGCATLPVSRLGRCGPQLTCLTIIHPLTSITPALIRPAGQNRRAGRCRCFHRAAPALGTYRHEGGPPMRRFLRPLGLAVALLAAVPALAADSDGTEKAKLDSILQEVRSLKKDLEIVQAGVKDMGQRMATDVNDLKRRMDTLEQTVERLSAGRTRISASFTPADNPPPTATLRLVNRHGAPATFFVNGQAYVVPAYSSQALPRFPVGSFTYEVQADGYEIQSPVRRNVAANETFSITVNPPA